MLLSLVQAEHMASATAPSESQQHVISSGNLEAIFTPEAGLTQLRVGGVDFIQANTASIFGSTYTLSRDAPAIDWPPSVVRRMQGIPRGQARDFAIYAGRRTSELRPGDKPKRSVVLAATQDRYTVRHEYEHGIVVTVDHEVHAPDVRCRLIVENDSDDFFQVHTWLPAKYTFDGPIRTPSDPQLSNPQSRSTYYPEPARFSPVASLWGDQIALGVNWVKHRMRPVHHEMRFDRDHPNRATAQFNLRNSPAEPGGRVQYEVVFRIDTTPGDWKYLLTPYKYWFNQYFGPVRYNSDLRLKVFDTPSNASLIARGLPWGMRGELGTKGWGAYIANRKLDALKGYDISHIVFWSFWASARGVNYRPEFNAMPPITRETLPQLRKFLRDAGMGFGVTSGVALQLAVMADWDRDDALPMNLLDRAHLRAAENRYREMRDLGATAFYLDVFKGGVMHYPNGEEAVIAHLGRVREIVGPDALLMTEHGVDAFMVFAQIWPSGDDDYGKRPFGEYARWLIPGGGEVCRVPLKVHGQYDLGGLRRAWEGGAAPIVSRAGFEKIADQVMAMQREYVRDDWTSTKRSDAPAVTRPPMPSIALEDQEPNDPRTQARPAPDQSKASDER